jgi:hypothetical protein
MSLPLGAIPTTHSLHPRQRYDPVQPFGARLLDSGSCRTLRKVKGLVDDNTHLILALILILALVRLFDLARVVDEVRLVLALAHPVDLAHLVVQTSAENDRVGGRTKDRGNGSTAGIVGMKKNTVQQLII